MYPKAKYAVKKPKRIFSLDDDDNLFTPSSMSQMLSHYNTNDCNPNTNKKTYDATNNNNNNNNNDADDNGIFDKLYARHQDDDDDEQPKKRKRMVISDGDEDSYDSDYCDEWEKLPKRRNNDDNNRKVNKSDSKCTEKRQKSEKCLPNASNIIFGDEVDDSDNEIITNNNLEWSGVYNSYLDDTPNFPLPNYMSIRPNTNNNNNSFTLSIPPVVQLLSCTDKSIPISQYLDNNRPQLSVNQKITQLSEFKFSQKITKKMGPYDDAFILHNNVFQFKLVNIEHGKIIDVVLSDCRTEQLYLINDRRLFQGWIEA